MKADWLNLKLVPLVYSFYVVFQKGVKQIPSYKFLPLMYQLAARMGTKVATGIGEDTGFHDVLNNVIQLFVKQQTILKPTFIEH